MYRAKEAPGLIKVVISVEVPAVFGWFGEGSLTIFVEIPRSLLAPWAAVKPQVKADDKNSNSARNFIRPILNGQKSSGDIFLTYSCC